jgi:hypothetical protein
MQRSAASQYLTIAAMNRFRQSMLQRVEQDKLKRQRIITESQTVQYRSWRELKYIYPLTET